MSNLIRSNKKLFVNSGGVLDPSIKPRIENLENNEYKILYFQTISSTTGTITKPTNSTILLDQFYSGGDAIVETLVNGQPSGQSPLTAGGSVVSVSSFDASGNFTLSGTPSSYPVALIYIFTIKAVDYSNVVKANEMNMENNSLAPLASPTFTGVATFQNIIRLTSASLGTAVAGNVEFLTDKFYGVITTGTSRKEFVLADTPLTSGRIIFTTTNGRAIDSSLLTFNGTTVNFNGAATAGGAVAVALAVKKISGSDGVANFESSSGILGLGVDTNGGYFQPLTPSRGIWIYNNAGTTSLRVLSGGGINFITPDSTSFIFKNGSTTRVTINAAGNIIFANMPTSPSGLAAGTLWSDAGTIKIV